MRLLNSFVRAISLKFNYQKRPARLAIGGLLILLLPLLLSACGESSVAPSDVAQHYLENIRDSAYTTAYDLLSSDSQLKVSRSQFADRLTRAKQEAGIARTDIVKIQSPNIVGKRASVAYQIQVTTQDNKQMPLFESLVLLQQDNGWRVVWPPQ